MPACLLFSMLLFWLYVILQWRCPACLLLLLHVFRHAAAAPRCFLLFVTCRKRFRKAGPGMCCMGFSALAPTIYIAEALRHVVIITPRHATRARARRGAVTLVSVCRRHAFKVPQQRLQTTTPFLRSSRCRRRIRNGRDIYRHAAAAAAAGFLHRKAVAARVAENDRYDARHRPRRREIVYIKSTGTGSFNYRVQDAMPPSRLLAHITCLRKLRGMGRIYNHPFTDYTYSIQTGIGAQIQRHGCDEVQSAWGHGHGKE